ncbi:hypothetical protein MHBO_004588, partial [Bonamia ostreae]
KREIVRQKREWQKLIKNKQGRRQMDEHNPSAKILEDNLVLEEEKNPSHKSRRISLRNKIRKNLLSESFKEMEKEYMERKQNVDEKEIGETSSCDGFHYNEKGFIDGSSQYCQYCNCLK